MYDSATAAHLTWARVKERLRVEVGDDAYEAWFGRIELEEQTEGMVRLSVPTRFLRIWITSRYAERVLACCQAEDPSVSRLELVERSAVLRPLPPQGPDLKGEDGITCKKPLISTVAVRPKAAAASKIFEDPGSPLNPRLTFDSFVLGSDNKLAYTAAMQVALAQGDRAVLFNPLYVHAEAGLGKTHLLQALAQVLNATGHRKALYMTAQKFAELAPTLLTYSALAFKGVLWGVQVLIIDDLQYLKGESAQAEFRRTLDAFIHADRQVVLGADRPLSGIMVDRMLDKSLRPHLEAGLAVEIGSPDQELQLNILRRRKAIMQERYPGFCVPEEVLGRLAQALTRSGHGIEDALNRLLAYHKVTGGPITMELAERECRSYFRSEEPRRVTIKDVQRAVAQRYNLSRAVLRSSRRTANIVRPRQIGMFLSKTLAQRSLPEIGRCFGGKDHTTVLHAVRKIERLAGSDPVLAEELESLKRQIYA